MYVHSVYTQSYDPPCGIRFTPHLHLYLLAQVKTTPGVGTLVYRRACVRAWCVFVLPFVVCCKPSSGLEAAVFIDMRSVPDLSAQRSRGKKRVALTTSLIFSFRHGEALCTLNLFVGCNSSFIWEVH